MYSKTIVVRAVHSALKVEPSLRLADVAQRLNVSTHTIIRALTQEHLQFRILRAKYLRQRVLRLSQTVPPLTHKEIAQQAGFSSADAFSHYLHRYNIQLFNSHTHSTHYNSRRASADAGDALILGATK